MQIEQLLLALPKADQPGDLMAVNDWCGIIDQFAAQGGRELILGGGEPLGYPAFWVLVRRATKAKVKVSAFFSGGLLEPWVMRELTQSSLQTLIQLDSVSADLHDSVHGSGSHARAMSGLERLTSQELVHRAGVIATATAANYRVIPQLAAWTAGRGLSRFLWVAPGLGAEEKAWLVNAMRTLSRTVPGETYIGAFDLDDDPALPENLHRCARVEANGEAFWGLESGPLRLGNLRYFPLHALVRQQAG